MSNTEMVPSLMLFTLIAVAVVGVVALLWFMRRRSNRHPMANQQERNIDEMREGRPPER